MNPAQSATTPKFERVCAKCGYNLRGLPSNRCPECGREFDPNAIFPEWALRYFQPMKWPLVSTILSMVLLLVSEAGLFMPAFVGLSIWLMCYIFIGTGSYWRIYKRKRILGKFGVSGIDVLPERAIFRRVRKWMYVTLALSILQIPQLLTFAIDLPWLYPAMHKMYEIDPFVGPHDVPTWCGISPVHVNWFSPSGVYFDIGSTNMAYSPNPTLTSHYEWIRITGWWWYGMPLDIGDSVFAETVWEISYHVRVLWNWL